MVITRKIPSVCFSVLKLCSTNLWTLLWINLNLFLFSRKLSLPETPTLMQPGSWIWRRPPSPWEAARTSCTTHGTAARYRPPSYPPITRSHFALHNQLQPGDAEQGMWTGIPQISEKDKSLTKTVCGVSLVRYSSRACWFKITDS